MGTMGIGSGGWQLVLGWLAGTGRFYGWRLVVGGWRGEELISSVTSIFSSFSFY